MKQTLVRKSERKALPYSIEIIGDKFERAKWKLLEDIRLSQHQAEAAARKALKTKRAEDAWLAPVELPTPELSEKPPTVFDKFKSICSKVWNNAFDSER